MATFIKIAKTKRDKYFAIRAESSFNFDTDGLVFWVKKKEEETHDQFENRVRIEARNRGISFVEGLDKR